MKNKKYIITFGLIAALGLGGIFALAKNNSFEGKTASNTDTNYHVGDTGNNTQDMPVFDSQEGQEASPQDIPVFGSQEAPGSDSQDMPVFDSQEGPETNPQEAIGSKYVYKNGKLEKYNENDTSQKDSLVIITDLYKEGDTLEILDTKE